MSGKGGTGQACAACKYQRRKCSPDCPLSPYFPPDQPKQFLNVHKLFGVSNVLRILRQVDESQKSDAMKSIIYQANAREKDPVHGCLGIIVMLQAQIERLKEEIETVRSPLMLLEQCNFQNPGMRHHIQNGFSGPFSLPTHAPVPTTWLYPYPHHSSLDGDLLLRQNNCDLMVGGNRFLEYHQGRQNCTETKEIFESSAESSLKDGECLERITEQEMKSAVPFITLTSQE